MATKRLNAQDYKKEFEDAYVKLEALRSRIKMRATSLCKRNPNIKVKISCYPSSHKASAIIRHLSFSDTSIALELIEQIEAELAKRHQHKQIEIDFKTE